MRSVKLGRDVCHSLQRDPGLGRTCADNDLVGEDSDQNTVSSALTVLCAYNFKPPNFKVCSEGP